MSDRILRQRHPNEPNTPATQKLDEEVAIHDPPSPAASEYNRKSKKRRITKNHSPTLTDPQINAPVSQIFQDPPTFHPIIPAYHPHEAYNTLPARLRHQNAVEPFDILKLFLTPSLIESMTYNTNAYAALKTSEHLQGGGRKWKAVSTLELSIWLGIVVYMGVHNPPAVRDYWRHDGLNPAHPISKHMGQTRFEEIKRYFHVSPPDRPKETPLGRRLWHSKVDEVLDQLCESSQRY